MINLDREDKCFLLKLARDTVAYYLENQQKPTLEQLNLEKVNHLNFAAGVFVTLKKKGDLRGCIGSIVSEESIVKGVFDYAIHAAFHDPRFPGLLKSEWDDIKFEISILTPPKTVNTYGDIIVGQHGVIFKKNGCSAVFLPKVAVEWNWGLEEMLTQLALKAGLEGHAWRHGAEFLVFEGIEFSE